MACQFGNGQTAVCNLLESLNMMSVKSHLSRPQRGPGSSPGIERSPRFVPLTLSGRLGWFAGEMAFVNAQERQLSALEPLELRHLPDEGLSYSEPVPQTWLKVALDGGATPGLDFAVLSAGRVTLTVTAVGSGR